MLLCSLAATGLDGTLPLPLQNSILCTVECRATLILIKCTALFYFLLVLPPLSRIWQNTSCGSRLRIDSRTISNKSNNKSSLGSLVCTKFDWRIYFCVRLQRANKSGGRGGTKVENLPTWIVICCNCQHCHFKAHFKDHIILDSCFFEVALWCLKRGDLASLLATVFKYWHNIALKVLMRDVDFANNMLLCNISSPALVRLIEPCFILRVGSR